MASEQATRFLDRLHEDVYTGLGISLPDAGTSRTTMDKSQAGVVAALTRGLPADQAAAFTEALGALVDQQLATPVSKYEEPGDVGMLHMLAEDLENAARRFDMPVPVRPLLGTLPTGQVNAMTVLVPGTEEHIVLFEREMLLFAHLSAKAIAEAVPVIRHDDGSTEFSYDDGLMRQTLAENPVVIRRFHEVTEAYLLTGRPGNAPQYFQEKPHSDLSTALRGGMELFVLGHEYGHIMREHLGRRQPIGLVNDAGATEISYDWQQEFEADLVGGELMIAAQRLSGYDVTMSYLGADFYFTMMDVLKRGLGLLRYGDEDRTTHTTHPPSSDRRDRLRAMMLRSAPPEIGEPAMERGIRVQYLVELLWDQVRPVLYDAHRSGARPLANWRD